jgi:hypothetical protein
MSGGKSRKEEKEAKSFIKPYGKKGKEDFHEYRN